MPISRVSASVSRYKRAREQCWRGSTEIQAFARRLRDQRADQQRSQAPKEHAVESGT